jgi:putative Ca2+/H+ antiporter (TMEM165/GDT1 family)
LKSSASPSSLPAISASQTDDRDRLPAASVAESESDTDSCREQTANIWNWGALGVFGSTFSTIFLAEMGDKTQLATLLMSAESQSPWVVFAGASAALIATSLIGILVGRWLAKYLTPKTLNLSAGILLLCISAALFWEILNS